MGLSFTILGSSFAVRHAGDRDAGGEVLLADQRRRAVPGIQDHHEKMLGQGGSVGRVCKEDTGQFDEQVGRHQEGGSSTIEVLLFFFYQLESCMKAPFISAVNKVPSYWLKSLTKFANKPPTCAYFSKLKI